MQTKSTYVFNDTCVALLPFLVNINYLYHWLQWLVAIFFSIAWHFGVKWPNSELLAVMLNSWNKFNGDPHTPVQDAWGYFHPKVISSRTTTRQVNKHISVATGSAVIHFFLPQTNYFSFSPALHWYHSCMTWYKFCATALS